MAVKRSNKYKIHLQELELKDGTQMGKSIEFDFENHDDIFKIIEQTKDTNRFRTQNENIQFIIGLKLFSEVMINNKNSPLFDDFIPAFKAFMKKLKGK
ncbi:DUF3861 domain-containing protein [Elizabethkingia anophelis]|nr:DUF3861 domain-containing protein [Elizabethkingia anophelis]